MMIMASAGHFLTLYLGLELLSLSLYAMVAFQRDSAPATEAAMKYFVLGALASGMLLYGMSMLYGATGSLEISVVRKAISSMAPDNMILIFGLVFVVVGLAFKLGVAPFHMWAPDVYHGAPTAVTVFLGTAPKLAAFAMLMRLLVGGLEADNAREVCVKATVLFVLRAVHSRIVCNNQHQTAIDRDQGRIDKWICSNVQTDVLHRDQRAPSSEGNTKRFFVGGLFVAAPCGMGSTVFVGISQ